MPDTVTIHIPTPFRGQAGDQATFATSGGTVREVLGALSGRYPEIGRRLFKTEGELNRFVNIFVNEEDIRFLDNLETSVAPGDDVLIIPAIAGG